WTGGNPNDGSAMRLMTAQLRRWLIALVALAAVAPVQAQPRGGGRRIDPETTMAGPALKAAFHDATTAARRSTARVRLDGKDAALGTVVGADGWVLTKASEVDAGKVTVMLQGGRELEAKVTGVNEMNDLAMLKIDLRGGQSLQPVSWIKPTDKVPAG